MRNTWKAWIATVALCGTAAAFAQTPAAAAAPAAAKPAAAMQTFLCKDGTSVQAETSKGACKGHKGIDKSGGASAAPAAESKAVPAAAAPAAAAPKAGAVPAPAKTAAPGGGAGKVWANNNTKVYHCQGDRYYGTTKNGEYMSEADAKAKGMHAAKGSKACSA
ncbi:hypothetical protein [Comamonas odontotermitis]|uniref:hypothetical protein n=1 Tax=Comamonas odontotermitis TaxID=379895 RepID=UPI001CC50131|nr:hypothetical protein [Comamonas odontotermitis]UBB17326.1 hypothetical protein LAD35_01290 [Comamonas odontotermitis]